MIKQLHKLMLLAVVALFAVNGHALIHSYTYADVVIDSICYDLDKNQQNRKITYKYRKTLDGCYRTYYNYYKGDVIIPTTNNAKEELS